MIDILSIIIRFIPDILKKAFLEKKEDIQKLTKYIATIEDQELAKLLSTILAGITFGLFCVDLSLRNLALQTHLYCPKCRQKVDTEFDESLGIITCRRCKTVIIALPFRALSVLVEESLRTYVEKHKKKE